MNQEQKITLIHLMLSLIDSIATALDGTKEELAQHQVRITAKFDELQNFVGALPVTQEPTVAEITGLKVVPAVDYRGVALFFRGEDEKELGCSVVPLTQAYGLVKAVQDAINTLERVCGGMQ